MAIVVAVALYVSLVLPVAMLPTEGLSSGLLCVTLYSFIAAEIALRITEKIFALLWPIVPILLADEAVPVRSVAVIMTVCDDLSLYHIEQLEELKCQGYDLYLLDDSTYAVELPKRLSWIVLSIRRRIRRGAKAGNLNNWLRLFGTKYDFCCVLDSDSIMPSETLLALRQAAAHPMNNRVAIFQTKIRPFFEGTTPLLTRLLGLGAVPRARVLGHVHARFNLVLSFGHNQLIRLSALRSVGGFAEDLSGEDTALTLDLAGRGWTTVLVDAWSYDSEPDSFSRYVRRTIRWARQTVELFHRGWIGVPLRLKFLLCRHLFAYLSLGIVITLLGISIWSGPTDIREVWGVISAGFKPAPSIFGTLVGGSVLITLVDFLLTYRLARSADAPRGLILLSIIWGVASCFLWVIPLTIGMFLSAIGRRTTFVPTNSPVQSRIRGLTLTSPAIILICYCSLQVILLTGLYHHPGSALIGFNGLWMSIGLTAPFLLVPYRVWRSLCNVWRCTLKQYQQRQE